jgi:hypothetical protein
MKDSGAMPARPVTHPSDETIQALADGRLTNPAVADTVRKHLASCADCRDKAVAQSGNNVLPRPRDARPHSHPFTTRPPSSPAQAAKAIQQGLTTLPILPELPAALRDHPHYELLRELGRGGMGVVYLARNNLMAGLEVLKAVNQQMLERSGAAERLLREIRSAAKLNHPHIVTAHTAFQLGELLVFAMEYVPGQDLAQVVKAYGGPLPTLNACYYVQQAVLGLQHAFEKGMVHRDIKPHNLILARDGKKHVVKILDFGLAKACTEGAANHNLTDTGQMLGTPDYMAPEQWRDAARADIRADIYSLGCTLYYLLAGQPPFLGRSLPDIWEAHQNRTARSLHDVRPEVPPELAAVVAKMMAKMPEQRYQTPIEVVQALLPFLRADGKGMTSGAASLPAAEEVRSMQAAGVRPETVAEGPKTVGETRQCRVTQTAQPSPWKLAVKRKWLLVSGAVAAVLMLALAGIGTGNVLKVKTKDGVIVLENLPADAEMLVDAEIVTVRWGQDGKEAEIHVQPGTGKIVATKDGVQFIGDEVEIMDSGRKVFTAWLESVI